MSSAPLSIRLADRRYPVPGETERLRHNAHRLWYRLVSAYQRHRQRRALAQLDPRLLRDVGLTSEQARLESAKPFWRG
jgi:uncharacterized protein YjiS (DUF1127 family)